MQIDPYLIYAIAGQSGQESNPYDLPPLSYMEQKQAELGLASLIDYCNWYLVVSKVVIDE